MPHIDLFDPSTTTEITLLLVAFVLSAAIGAERQRALKSAGLRTHTLVGLGSALFALVSGHGFTDVLGHGVVLDPSRIAAQVASGIGFLGAGVIFIRHNSVSGLTTAASIWVTAAIGLACGAGLPTLAAAATVLYLIAAVLMSTLGRIIGQQQRRRGYLIRYDDGSGVLRRVLAEATQLGFEAALLNARQLETRPTRVEANLRFTRNSQVSFDDFATLLTEIDGVISVDAATNEHY